jgi:hypothetical protein
MKPDQWVNREALIWTYSAEVVGRLRGKAVALNVLRSYAIRANDDDEAWPASATVQDENGIGSDNTVAKWLKHLCAAGLLERTDVRRELGGAQVYRVLWRVRSSAVIGAELRGGEEAPKFRSPDVEVPQSRVRSSARMGADEEEQGEEVSTHVDVGTDAARASASASAEKHGGADAQQDSDTRGDEVRAPEGEAGVDGGESAGDDAGVPVDAKLGNGANAESAHPAQRILLERWRLQRPPDAPRELEALELAAIALTLGAVEQSEASAIIDREARRPSSVLWQIAQREDRAAEKRRNEAAA